MRWDAKSQVSVFVGHFADANRTTGRGRIGPCLLPTDYPGFPPSCNPSTVIGVSMRAEARPVGIRCLPWKSAPSRRQPPQSRTQHLSVDAERAHVPSTYAGCGRALTATHERLSQTYRYALGLIQPGVGDTGLVQKQTKHLYFPCCCDCGHWTQAQPGRCAAEPEWTVELTEWHLAGPALVTFIGAFYAELESRGRVGRGVRRGVRSGASPYREIS